jgi:hypothetical protein
MGRDGEHHEVAEIELRRTPKTLEKFRWRPDEPEVDILGGARRSTRSSTTRPPLSMALSPSSRAMRARKRSKTRSWRLRAKSIPLDDEERRRVSTACLNAAAVA